VAAQAAAFTFGPCVRNSDMFRSWYATLTES
jgi:hypothetical protein